MEPLAVPFDRKPQFRTPTSEGIFGAADSSRTEYALVMVSSDIVVTPVEGKSDLKAFINLPKRLFAGHKGYVPHLDVERQEAFSPKKNPLFKHVEVQFFLARRAGKVVGRITA